MREGSLSPKRVPKVPPAITVATLIMVPVIFSNHQSLSKRLSIQVPGTFTEAFTTKALFKLPSALI